MQEYLSSSEVQASMLFIANQLENGPVARDLQKVFSDTPQQPISPGWNSALSKM